jgi:hypothetical protein
MSIPSSSTRDIPIHTTDISIDSHIEADRSRSRPISHSQAQSGPSPSSITKNDLDFSIDVPDDDRSKDQAPIRRRPVDLKDTDLMKSAGNTAPVQLIAVDRYCKEGVRTDNFLWKLWKWVYLLLSRPRDSYGLPAIFYQIRIITSLIGPLVEDIWSSQVKLFLLKKSLLSYGNIKITRAL